MHLFFLQWFWHKRGASKLEWHETPCWFYCFVYSYHPLSPRPNSCSYRPHSNAPIEAPTLSINSWVIIFFTCLAHRIDPPFIVRQLFVRNLFGCVPFQHQTKFCPIGRRFAHTHTPIAIYYKVVQTDNNHMIQPQQQFVKLFMSNLVHLFAQHQTKSNKPERKKLASQLPIAHHQPRIT